MAGDSGHGRPWAHRYGCDVVGPWQGHDMIAVWQVYGWTMVGAGEPAKIPPSPNRRTVETTAGVFGAMAEATA